MDRNFYDELCVEGYTILEHIDVVYGNEIFTLCGFDNIELMLNDMGISDYNIREYGTGYYFMDGKYYVTSVFYETLECVSIRELKDDEVSKLFNKLVNEFGIVKDDIEAHGVG